MKQGTTTAAAAAAATAAVVSWCYFVLLASWQGMCLLPPQLPAAFFSQQCRC
jgi:hypothetical protein